MTLRSRSPDLGQSLQCLCVPSFGRPTGRRRTSIVLGIQIGTCLTGKSLLYGGAKKSAGKLQKAPRAGTSAPPHRRHDLSNLGCLRPSAPRYPREPLWHSYRTQPGNFAYDAYRKTLESSSPGLGENLECLCCVAISGCKLGEQFALIVRRTQLGACLF